MLADRVLHTSTTTGTGTYDLIDWPSGKFLSAVDSVGSGNQFAYVAEMGDAWEICRGTVTAGSPATLTRNLFRSSTGALINWGAGIKTIYSISQADLVRFGARGSLPTSGGTANAQTIAHVTPLRSLAGCPEIIFLPGNTNTGATTLAVDSLGAITLTAPGGGACVGGELRAGIPTRAMHDGTNWRLLSLPAPAAPTTAAGVGQRLGASTAANTAYVLPSGGTWEYRLTTIVTATAAWGAFRARGVAAGGSTVASAVPGEQWDGEIWRIA